MTPKHDTFAAERKPAVRMECPAPEVSTDTQETTPHMDNRRWEDWQTGGSGSRREWGEGGVTVCRGRSKLLANMRVDVKAGQRELRKQRVAATRQSGTSCEKLKDHKDSD